MPLQKLRMLVVLMTLSTVVRGQIIQPDKQQAITRILFIFDASQSMYGRWQSDTKINIASRLMTNWLDSLKTAENVELALRVYGHQRNFPPQDCNDTKLEIPFARNNIHRIKSKIKELAPRGTTPIAQSLIDAAQDFPPCTNCRNIIVLITDGIEECGGDPCQASRHLQERGITLKPFVIGIGRDFRTAFECVGTYYDALNEQEFNAALNAVFDQALNVTTLQVNLLDPFGNPTETNMNMVFSDRKTSLPRYSLIHTLNRKGLPDTLALDPLVIYDLAIQTTPVIKVDSLALIPGRHNAIEIPAPQGSLLFSVKGKDKLFQNLSVIVREAGKAETLHVQAISENKKYLVGKYDIEVLSLPRISMMGVEVKHQRTTTLEIPMPGIIVINKVVLGFGSLYVMKNNQPVWIHDLREGMLQETLTLMPGEYKIFYRSKSVDRSRYTVEKEFTVLSGQTKNVKIF